MDVVTSNKTLGHTEILYIHNNLTDHTCVFRKVHSNSKNRWMQALEFFLTNLEKIVAIRRIWYTISAQTVNANISEKRYKSWPLKGKSLKLQTREIACIKFLRWRIMGLFVQCEVQYGRRMFCV